MNIERLCITLITRLFFDSAKGGLMDKGFLNLIKEKYNLENISLRFFNAPSNHVMLHIQPSNTNYKLSANFKINDGRIIFNIQRREVEAQLEISSEYKIDNNTINHVYQTTGVPSRIHSNSVNSAKFVKFNNPYYTVNQLLTKINKDDKPDMITVKSSLEEVNIAKDYVFRYLEQRMLIDLRLDSSDLDKIRNVFRDQKSKKEYDNKLRHAFEYYTRFMRRNIKVFYPEQLHEIPENKEQYITNNFYTNNLATRYGNYYEDVRTIFTKSSNSVVSDRNYIKVEEYIDPLNIKFQKPFTTTDIFLFYFGRKESSMERYNLSTVEHVMNLFNYIEILKSIMFTFVSLYIKISRNMDKISKSIMNLNIKINQNYPSISWTKLIESNNICEISITLEYHISKKGTDINIKLCDKKCKPLEYLDVIEIPYKNTILPIQIKKVPLYKSDSIKPIRRQIIYTSLEDLNIPLEVFKDSIEGAILSNRLNHVFLSSLRKRFHETDDFSNNDETIYNPVYTELSVEEYLSQYPPLKPEGEVQIIDQPGYTDENEDKDEDINEVSSLETVSYIKPTNFDELEYNAKIQAEFTRLNIDKLKQQIELNKLKREFRPISKEYSENKFKLSNLQRELKAINKDLEEERYIEYENEENPENIELYYDELEQYRDELYEQYNNYKVIYDKLFVTHNSLSHKIRKMDNIYIPSFETQIRQLIKSNPNIIFTKFKCVIELEQQERNSRELVKTVDKFDDNEDEQILKGKQTFDEITDEKNIDIGYGTSISRLKEKILDGLSEVSIALIATKNKAIKTETDSKLQTSYDMRLIEEAGKEVLLRQEESRKQIELARQEQIKQFAQEDIRFKQDLKFIEEEFDRERLLKEQLEEIETQKIVALHSERIRLIDAQEQESLIAELAEKERLLKEEFEKRKEERKLSWESKIRELEIYILDKEKELDKIPTLHKNRYTIYKLTILIRNATRLLNNEKSLRRLNDNIFRLQLDYEKAMKTRTDTEAMLLSENKQIRRVAFNAVKNEQVLKESIEEIEDKMDRIKKFIRNQRKIILEKKKLGLIKTWPDVDEHLLKHKQELMDLLKRTKEKIQL